MSTRSKQKKSERKDTPSQSTMLRGKSGKILTVDLTGMPCYGKIEKTVGFHPETPVIAEIVPVYQECSKCNVFLGHLEEVNADELDHMCIDCFKIEIGEEVYFSPIGESNTLCTSCGLYMEKGDDLFSTLNGVCNHCYLRKMNLDKTHSCIHCDPTFKVVLKKEFHVNENTVSQQISPRPNRSNAKSGGATQ